MPFFNSVVLLLSYKSPLYILDIIYQSNIVNVFLLTYGLSLLHIFQRANVLNFNKIQFTVKKIQQTLTGPDVPGTVHMQALPSWRLSSGAQEERGRKGGEKETHTRN